MRVRLEGIVQVSDRYRTLFNGLRKNHPHSATVVYPLTFLARRVIYSAIILFMSGVSFVGAFILSILCLFMIAYVIVE